jgi:hypothetical protein
MDSSDVQYLEIHVIAIQTKYRATPIGKLCSQQPMELLILY